MATRVARTGIDGIIFLAEKADYIREFQKNAVADKETREFLKDHGGDEVLELFNKWGKAGLKPDFNFPFSYNSFFAVVIIGKVRQ